jgi:hypothetical protein
MPAADVRVFVSFLGSSRPRTWEIVWGFRGGAGCALLEGVVDMYREDWVGLER